MCKFIGKSNERILCKLNKIEILRLYSIVHVAMETTKTSNFTCQSKSFISIFFTCKVSACELQPFSCHDLANDIHSQTAKTVFSHLKEWQLWVSKKVKPCQIYPLSTFVRVQIAELRTLPFIFKKSPSCFVLRDFNKYNCCFFKMLCNQARFV